MNLEITLILTVALVNTILFGINKFILKRNHNALFCGIVGFSSKKKSNPDKLALLMLHNSLKRGEDNTGVYTPEDGVCKSTKNATEFLSEYDMPRTNLFIGHVRKSSVGSKIVQNAHPFEFDNIVLVHNGTLNNHWQMLREAGIDQKEFNTDTQVLAKLLDNDSKKEQKVFSTLSEYQGFAALLFTDKRQPEILYAYRNSDRPLFHGLYEGSLYISSLKESLEIIKCTDIDEFPPYYLHTIKNGKVLESIYYKEKTSSFSQTAAYGHITNVKYKNNDSNIEDFVKSIKAAETVTTDMLVDKWVKCLNNIDCEYGKQNKVKFTKDKWYQVCDNATSNEYDIQLIDDTNTLVWSNKYMFNTNYIGYPNGFCQAVINIFDMNKKNDGVLFTRGTIITIAPNAIIDGDNKLSCIYNDDIHDIDISCIRPTEDSEVEKFMEQNVKELNKSLKDNKQKSINFNDIDLTKKPVNISTIMDAESSNPTALLPALKIVKRGSEDELFIEEKNKTKDKTIDVIHQFTDEERVIHYILDVVSDVVDDIIEISNTIDLDELKVKVDELKDIIDESYNIENVKSILQDDDTN